MLAEGFHGTPNSILNKIRDIAGLRPTALTYRDPLVWGGALLAPVVWPWDRNWQSALLVPAPWGPSHHL